MFLNKKTFLNASLINEKTAISKEKLFEKLEKNHSLQNMKNVYDPLVILINLLQKMTMTFILRF